MRERERETSLVTSLTQPQRDSIHSLLSITRRPGREGWKETTTNNRKRIRKKNEKKNETKDDGTLFRLLGIIIFFFVFADGPSFSSSIFSDILFKIFFFFFRNYLILSCDCGGLFKFPSAALWKANGNKQAREIKKNRYCLPMSIALLLLRFLRFSLKMWSRSWPRFTPGHPSKYRSQEVSSLSFSFRATDSWDDLNSP